MLFWELIFDKIPYQGWEAKKIEKHIVDGGRERFMFEVSTLENKKLKNIINDSE